MESQGKGIREAQCNKSSIQRASQGDGGEYHSCQEQVAYEVNSYRKPPDDHQVEVRSLRVLILEPGGGK